MPKSFEERLKDEIKDLHKENLFREPLALNKNFLNLATNDYFLLRHNKQVLEFADTVAHKIWHRKWCLTSFIWVSSMSSNINK